MSERQELAKEKRELADYQEKLKSRKEEIERVNERDTQTEKKLKDTQNDVINAKGEFRRNQQVMEDLDSRIEQLEKERNIRSSKVDEVTGLIDSKRLGSFYTQSALLVYSDPFKYRVLFFKQTTITQFNKNSVRYLE